MSFNEMSRILLDNWLSHANPTPEQLYGTIIDRLSIRWRVALIRLEGNDPDDWVLEPVKQMKLKFRLIDLNKIFAGGRLGDIKDRNYLESAVLPQYGTVIQTRQPAMDRVEAKLLGMKLVYDRIVLPQKSDIGPSWLLTCTYGRFLSPLPGENPVVDDVDQSVVLHLSGGFSAKEIASILNLSHRTIEHRIDRMKRQTGARNTTHLVALCIAAGFEGELRFRKDG